MNGGEHWIITGATSTIAKAFCQSVASTAPGMLTLIARDEDELQRMQSDLTFKYDLTIRGLVCDLSAKETTQQLIKTLNGYANTTPTILVLMHSITVDNLHLDHQQIQDMLEANVTSSCQLIHWFVNQHSQPSQLLYVSSVAGDRGRPFNSLYGASKRCVDLYLAGLRPSLAKRIPIHVFRLGWIDTHQTFGLPIHRFAASPAACAKTCLQALQSRSAKIRYFPRIWYGIMWLICRLPSRWLLKLR